MAAQARRPRARRGIHFFSSPFDHEAVDGLAALGVPAMKIASFEIVDLPLIRKAASVGVPIILSTGMAVYGEIEDALAAVAEAGNEQVALLRCASLYPAPPTIMNLRSMATLRGAFGVPVGLSDHTEGIAVPTGAAALGMDLLEKHFTLSRDMEGPDHPFAIEPDELRALVEAVRDVEAALGTGRLEGPSELERSEMFTLGRRSLIAATDIAPARSSTADADCQAPGLRHRAEGHRPRRRPRRARRHRVRRHRHLGHGLGRARSPGERDHDLTAVVRRVAPTLAQLDAANPASASSPRSSRR